MQITPEELSKIEKKYYNIPPIIHQTWKTKKIPLEFHKWVNSWKLFNSCFYHVIWDDKEIFEFIDKNYPEYKELYNSFRRPVEIADFFRYLIVYHYGGIYADLDVECCKPIESLIKTEQNLFCCIEKYARHTEDMNSYKLIRKEQLCQWFFGAKKGCVTLKRICDSINSNYPRNTIVDYKLVDTMINTGPGVFSDIVLIDKFLHGAITIYPQYYFAYGSCFTTGFDDDYPEWVEKVPKTAHKEELIFVKHHFMGSWKDNDKLKNENMF